MVNWTGGKTVLLDILLRTRCGSTAKAFSEHEMRLDFLEVARQPKTEVICEV